MNAKRVALAALVAWGLSPYLASAQQGGLNKDAQVEIAQIMRDAHDEVKKHYYDPKLHGIDWDARYKEYAAKAAGAHDLGQAFRAIAAFLGGLDDSHVTFIPPSRRARYDSGYKLDVVGNDCFVTQLRPKSDAESKLHIGDQVVTLNGFNVNRADFHDMSYFFNVLSPLTATQFGVRSPDGNTRTVVVNHATKPGQPITDLTSWTDYTKLVIQEQNEDHAARSRIVEEGDVAIWKLQQFDLDLMEIDHFVGIARKHKALVLDLRGNGGGSVETLKLLVSFLFDHEVKIANRVGRKETKDLTAKNQGKPFAGKLIVLVDARSASAAEMFARVVQLEHRGTVIGDKTAGAVMEARFYDESLGNDVQIFYGFEITDANVIMSDGKSLEKVGVTPDEVVLPTGADLSTGRDPVMVRAVSLAGGTIDADRAGKVFPFEWAPFL